MHWALSHCLNLHRTRQPNYKCYYKYPARWHEARWWAKIWRLQTQEPRHRPLRGEAK